MKKLSEYGPSEQPRRMTRRAVCVVAGLSVMLAAVLAFAQEGRYDDRFVRIAEEIKPSVVSLTVTTVADERGLLEKGLIYWLGQDSVRFWKAFWYEKVVGIPSPHKRGQNKVGTGLVIRGDGLVLTNEHLVRGGTGIWATLVDGRAFPAELVAADEWFDLAVLRVSARGLKVPKFGDSNRVQVGQEILIAGNALGYPNSLSQGIISGKGRFVYDEYGRVFENYFQTDAAMNFGHSGGPLINLDGEVIGLNMAIIPHSQNMAFALPSKEFLSVLPELIQNGKIQCGWIGTRLEERRQAGGTLLVIEAIYRNSPAHRGGLRPGDQIVDVDGAQLNSAYEFYKLVRESAPGRTLAVRVNRFGEPVVAQVTVSRFPKRTVDLQKVPLLLPWWKIGGWIPATRGLFLALLALLGMFTVRMYGWQGFSRDRRYGVRRKGDRRKGERRKVWLSAAYFSRVALERRSKERRQSPRRSPAGRRKRAV